MKANNTHPRVSPSPCRGNRAVLLGGTKSDLLDITKDVTYTMGLDLFIDEGTSEASTMWSISTKHVDAYTTLRT